MSALLIDRDLGAIALQELATDLRLALLYEPTRVVMTPAFGKVNTACDVILDSFSGESGAKDLAALLSMVGRFAQDGDTEALRWISTQAATHAKYHAHDYVCGMLESGDD